MSMKNPDQCPECKSESIDCGPVIEEDTKTLARWVVCDDCGCEWYQTFTLSKVTVDGGAL